MAKAKPVLIKFEVELSLTALIKDAHTELSSYFDKVPSVRMLSKNEKFVAALIEFVKTDMVTGYQNQWFEDGLIDAIEGSDFGEVCREMFGEGEED
jgi:hypothetical protein